MICTGGDNAPVTRDALQRFLLRWLRVDRSGRRIVCAVGRVGVDAEKAAHHVGGGGEGGSLGADSLAVPRKAVP